MQPVQDIKHELRRLITAIIEQPKKVKPAIKRLEHDDIEQNPNEIKDGQFMAGSYCYKTFLPISSLAQNVFCMNIKTII